MPKKEQNQKCPCDYPCPRHGDCEACKAYHKGGQTACQRLGKEEM